MIRDRIGWPVAMLAIALAGGTALADTEGAGTPVAVTTAPVPLDPSRPSRRHIGALTYLGGLVLTASDPRLTGLSALRWLDDRLVAVSDQDGNWFAFRPVERNHRLIGVADVRIAALSDEHGHRLSGKEESDAESMTLLGRSCRRSQCPPDAVAIGFERDDRVLVYRLRDALPVGPPQRVVGLAPWLDRQPDNLGIEAMAGDARSTLVISEGLRTASGEAAALLVQPGIPRGRTPTPLGIPAPGSARPSDIDRISRNRYVMLRRSWNDRDGFAVTIDEVRMSVAGVLPVARSRPLAHFASPLTTDNFEGVAVRSVNGRTYLYIVSDDNGDPAQRTLLLKFELTGRSRR